MRMYYEGLNLTDRHVYSGALREHFSNGREYLLDDPDDLRYSVQIPKYPRDQIDKLLLYIASVTDSLTELTIFRDNDYPLAYARKDSELFHLLDHGYKMGYFDIPFYSGAANQVRLSITLGWNRVAELRQSSVSSDQAFVAMWFDKSMDDAWQEGLIPALEKTGFSPLRIDKKEHNNQIDDEMIAEIRRSGLLVADFTGNSEGVYFEAGFAMGLGIRVIRTCREDWIDKAHFDTRQYSHIVWSTPDDLKTQLINRIEATIPKLPTSRTRV